MNQYIVTTTFYLTLSGLCSDIEFDLVAIIVILIATVKVMKS